MSQTALRDEKIFIKSNYRGFIPQLRMRGPIITPIRVTRAMAHQLIVAGIDVYEIDKATRKATQLTLQSVFPGEGDEAAARERARYAPKKPPVIKSANLTDKDPVKPTILSGVSFQDSGNPVQYRSVTDSEKERFTKAEEDATQDMTVSTDEKDASQSHTSNQGQNPSKKNKKNRNR